MRLLAICLVLLVASSKLHQVATLFRHGARYHFNDFYDGNSTRTHWGELTPVGQRQHQNLGSLLRHDYIEHLGFLHKNYTGNSIEVFSSDFNRTIQSARSLLYGLYPLGSGKKLPKVLRDYLTPPFKGSKGAQDNEYVLPDAYLPFAIQFNNEVVITECKNMVKQFLHNVNTHKPANYDEMMITYRPLLEKLGKIFSIQAQAIDAFEIRKIYDVLSVDKYLGRPLPANFTEEDYLNTQHLHYWHFFLMVSSNLSKAYNTGKLNRILEDFDGRIAGLNTKVLKWTFMSAHDLDISSMLLDLNISSSQCVEDLYRKGKTDSLNCSPNQEFASNIIFELHSDNDVDFYVKVRHNGKYVYLCERKSTNCPYDEWKMRVKQNVIISNVWEVCFGNEDTKET